MYLRGFQDLLFHDYKKYSKTKPISGLINSTSFAHILQVLDMCTFGDAADINSEIKYLPDSLLNMSINSSDCMCNPFFHLCYIAGQREYINTIFNVTL